MVRRPTARLTDLVANHSFCNARLVRDSVAKLVTSRRFWNTRRHGQHAAQEQPPVLRLTEVQPCRGLIEQVLKYGREARNLSRYRSPP